MITRVLVANRGEIARRVFATCRRLGISTAAVYSDADADLPFVGEADVAVRLPGTSPAETYLRGDLIIEAARRTGADAIHPGYGFLSENAEFARAVANAGLTWIGPTPESIEQMGSKVESKKLMDAAGVPVLSNLTAETATEADLPLLVKASAGGGGRGMRIVRALAELTAEVGKASAEAESAFGDGTVFVEPYVEHGRHVEVQVWGDHGGTNVSVLGARDCSIQRRHQKVVEESPPPGLSAETLEEMYAAAKAAASAISYVGAGTVEFLVDADDPSRFWFLEMNTRLQVEHPVTEAVCDVDLVELQLMSAEDPTALGITVGENGHAIEVRLYAEDPASDWQPQSGRLVTFEIPCDDEFTLEEKGIRVDSGFVSGSEVSTHYDAMLAKVVAWAPTRSAAARRLASALERARIHGVTTNRDLLVRILRSREFLDGEVSTDYFDRVPGLLSADSGTDLEIAAFAGAVALAEHDRARRVVQQGVPVAWRNVVSQPQRTEFDGVTVEWTGGRDGYRHAAREIAVTSVSPEQVVLDVDGVTRSFETVIVDDEGVSPREVFVDGADHSVRLREVPRFVDPADAVATGSLLAPMPGTVVALPRDAGSAVVAGDPVIVLEAMKMQHTIKAPDDGVLELSVALGQQVAAGDVLAVVSAAEPQGDDQ